MMKIVSYLAFTMLSVTIQFAIIDYIQANNLEVIEMKKDVNVTSQKKSFSDILQDISNKPYALYYHTNESTFTNNTALTTSIYSNVNVSTLEAESPPTTTSAYDILLYDDNTTASFTTSEIPYTTTEIENSTDLTIFNKKNETAIKPANKPKKKTYQKYCSCNLLYQVCDNNCCCDGDCTDNDRKMFNCMEKGTNLKEDDFYCSVPKENIFISSNIDNLFCVAKTNLPEKRIININEYDPKQMKKYTGRALKWHDNPKIQQAPQRALFHKNYTYGDPLILLRNGSIFHIDLPFSKVNNYCDDRTPILFLRETKIECNIVIRDLEMFHISKNLEDTSIISFTNESMNSTALNCSTAYCTNWSTIVCDETSCTNFNKTLHEPTCNIICTNFALKVEYVFYYYDSKIINATLYFYTQSVSPRMPFFRQQVSVKFYLLKNDTLDKVVKLSGQPGYIKDLPVIASTEKGNYSLNYFSNETDNRYMSYPENKNGGCVLSSTTKKIVNFGINKRSKCRYLHDIKTSANSTTCEQIQKKVKNLLGISKKIVISPLGNPYDLKDEDWLDLEIDAAQLSQSYGEKVDGTLYCYHMMTKLSLIFGYADVSDVANKENMKILTAVADVKTQNLTFFDDNFSVVLTVDIIFVDVTNPPVYEYAGSPQLNIHLPRDFFFPFPSNRSYSIYECSNLLMLLTFIVITFIPK